jgi:hypothetical protein
MKERSEIVVVLIPRVYPYSQDYMDYEWGNVVRAETDLFEGPLLRKDRPWQPKLPDALTNPRILRLPPVGKVYPYPAAQIEMANTPQLQREFRVPRRPGPALPWAPGSPPYAEPIMQAEPIPFATGEASNPIVFGDDSASEFPLPIPPPPVEDKLE